MRVPKNLSRPDPRGIEVIRSGLEKREIELLKHFKKTDQKAYDLLKKIFFANHVILEYYSGKPINDQLLDRKVKEIGELIGEVITDFEEVRFP